MPKKATKVGKASAAGKESDGETGIVPAHETIDVRNDAMAEAEFFDRRRTVFRWMYQFCCRHGLEGARQGLIQDGARLHNFSISDLQEDMVLEDPLDSLKILVHKGELEAVFRDFENVCPDDVDKSPKGMFSTVLTQLKVQIALKHLRQDTPAFDEFERCVKLLFNSKSVNDPNATLQRELCSVLEVKKTSSGAQQAKLVLNLLEKYSKDNFLRLFDEFASANQRVAILDQIVVDIDSGIYDPNSTTIPANSPGVEHELVKDVPLPKEIPIPRTGVNAAEPDNVDKVARNVQQVKISAWQIRKGADLEDDDAAWSEVHQETHPSIKDLLARRARAGKVAQPTRPAKKRDRSPVHLDEEEESVAGDQQLVKHRTGQSETRTKKQIASVTAPIQRGRKLRVPQSPASDSEKENSAPSPGDSSPVLAHPGTASAVGMETVDALRESRRALRCAVNDPLEDVRRAAASALPSATTNATLDTCRMTAVRGNKKTKLIDLNTDDPGRQCKWSSDEDSDDGLGDDGKSTGKVQSKGSMRLSSPHSNFRPKDRLGGGGVGSSRSDPADRTVESLLKRRWTEEEVQNLKNGIERYGVGRWSDILKEFKFHNRTQVDLKDKWRNLNKYNHV